MLIFLLRRVGLVILTALCLTLIVFSLVNLKPNLIKLANWPRTATTARFPSATANGSSESHGAISAIPPASTRR